MTGVAKEQNGGEEGSHEQGNVATAPRFSEFLAPRYDPSPPGPGNHSRRWPA